MSSNDYAEELSKLIANLNIRLEQLRTNSQTSSESEPVPMTKRVRRRINPEVHCENVLPPGMRRSTRKAINYADCEEEYESPRKKEFKSKLFESKPVTRNIPKECTGHAIGARVTYTFSDGTAGNVEELGKESADQILKYIESQPAGKYVIYTRVSSKDQTKQASLETQEKECLKSIKNKENAYTISEHYHSAFRKRPPILNKLLSVLKSGDKLVIYEISRFARNTSIGIDGLDFLLKNGITVASVQDELIVTPESTITRHRFLQSLTEAENYARLQSEKIKAGLKTARENGVALGIAPFGMRKINKRLEREPIEAAIINEILRKKGSWKPYEIARYLNSKGSLRRGKTWSSYTVQYIINKHSTKITKKRKRRNK